MSTFTAGVRGVAAAAGASAEASLNETVLRVAVTGLSRAGKTVFITSLIQNLLAFGQGRNTLPRLTDVLTAGGENRLKRLEILPAGAAVLPHFDVVGKFAELASERPSWPPRTEDLAQVSLNLEVTRADPRWRKLGTRRIRLDILDYPGEWLLDLPVLKKSYATWSAETLARLRRPPRDAVCADFFAFLRTFDPNARPNDTALARGFSLYRHALDSCRSKLGMRYLQPGRFLCLGPRPDAPFLWFFPTDAAEGRAAGNGTARALLNERFEAYKADMKESFFDKHFVNFDRQVVLVDVLGALHAGREAFEDIEEAIADIAGSLDYCGGLPKALHASGAAGLQVLARLRPSLWTGKSHALGNPVRGIVPRVIQRIAFVATKADHVPAMQRDNLRNLVRTIAETARSRKALGRCQVSYHAAASVVSTRDGTSSYGGRQVEVVVGVLDGEIRERPFYPGEVPSGKPRDGFWNSQYFEMPVFIPPRIEASGRNGIAHLDLDTIMVSLLGDQL